MLSGLNKKFRLKAALALAALYAFCVLLPHAALALTHGGTHCLTEPHVHQRPAPKIHVHADGVTHTHPDDTNHHSDTDGKNSGNCCGLFCITALAHEPVLAIAAPMISASVGPGLDDALAGRGPDLIKRPPRT